MITTATAYSDVRAMARAVNSPPHAATVARSRRLPPNRYAGAAGSQAGGDPRRGPRPHGAPAILVPTKRARFDWDEWFWRELRNGGCLDEYLRREKAQNSRRLRRVAQRMDGFKQNNKSDWRLVAALPSRVAHRMAKEIPEFWADDAALRSLKRDEPEARVYV